MQPVRSKVIRKRFLTQLRNFRQVVRVLRLWQPNQKAKTSGIVVADRQIPEEDIYMIVLYRFSGFRINDPHHS